MANIVTKQKDSIADQLEHCINASPAARTNYSAHRRTW